MSTLRLYTALLFSFLAAQALSLPYLDPRYPSGHDIRSPAAQSTTFTATTVLTLPSSLPTPVSAESGFARRLNDESPRTPAPYFGGHSREFRARRGEASDSHHTPALTEKPETANYNPESGYSEDADPDTTILSRSTMSPISTSNAHVSTDATENQEEAKLIKKASTTNVSSRCAFQDYECKNQPHGAVTASGHDEVVEGDHISRPPIKSNDPPPAEYVEHPPPTGHK